jgi:hypothetical protein
MTTSATIAERVEELHARMAAHAPDESDQCA